MSPKMPFSGGLHQIVQDKNMNGIGTTDDKPDLFWCRHCSNAL